MKSRLFLPILLATLAACSEYLHLLFTGTVHSEVVNEAGNFYKVYMDDAVWYFVNALFTLVLCISVLGLLKKADKAGALIMSGVIGWFSVELVESFCFLAKINNYKLLINDWSWLQISLLVSTSLLAFYGHIKFKS